MAIVWNRWRRTLKDNPAPEPEYVSLFDPGSGTIRAAVARWSGKEAEIVGLGVAPAAGILNPESLIADPAALARACKAALEAAEAQAADMLGRPVRPARAVVGLPAVWLWGGEYIHSQARLRPDEPVNEREVQTLLGRARRAAETLALERLGLPGSVVEVALVEMRLDDHRVSDPLGFRGGALAGTFFAAAASRGTVRAWRLVGEALGLETITLTPAALALAYGRPSGESLLLDVGAEATDLAWLCRGYPLRLESFLLGGQAMTRALQERLGLSEGAAGYLKHCYAAGQVEGDRAAEVRSALAPAVQDWYSRLQVGLASLARGEPLPAALLLLGGSAWLPEVADATRALAWSERLEFVRYPQVQLWQPTDVPGVVDRAGRGTEGASIPLLALAAWLAGRA